MADRPGLRARARGALAARLWRFAGALERRSRGRVPAPPAVAVGAGATIGPDVRFVGAGPFVVGAGAWVGRGARIIAGVEIGPGAVVQPYAVVHHDVPAGAIVEGNPAAVVGRRRPEADGV